MLLLQGSLKELNLPKNIFVGGYQGVYKPKSGVKTGLTGAVQRVSGHWAVGLFTQRRHLHHWLSFIFCIVIIQSPDVTTGMTHTRFNHWYVFSQIMVCCWLCDVISSVFSITRCHHWFDFDYKMSVTTCMTPITVNRFDNWHDSIYCMWTWARIQSPGVTSSMIQNVRFHS